MLENMIVLFVIYIFPLLHSKLSTSLYTASVVFVLHPVLLLLLYFIISHTYVCWVLLLCCYVYFFLLFFWVMLLGAERIRIESNRNWNRTENIKIGVDFSQFISISNVDSVGVVYVCILWEIFWEGLLLLYMLFLFFNCLFDVIWQKSFIRLFFGIMRFSRWKTWPEIRQYERKSMFILWKW